MPETIGYNLKPSCKQCILPVASAFLNALYERYCFFKRTVPCPVILLPIFPPLHWNQIKKLPPMQSPPACDGGQKNHRTTEHLELEGIQIQLPAPHRSIAAHNFT